MEKVTNMEELATRLIEVVDGNEGVTIQMVNCNDSVFQAMDQCDPKQEIQRFASLTAAAVV